MAKKSWVPRLDKVKKFLILIGFVFVYLFIVDAITTETILILGILTGAVFLLFKEDKFKIGQNEAERIVLEDILARQARTELDDGQPEIKDSGMKYLFSSVKGRMFPFAWYIGVKINGALPKIYLMKVSLDGGIFHREEKPEDWSLSDEPDVKILPLESKPIAPPSQPPPETIPTT